MDYNTQRPKIAMPEYGRNVHSLIQFAKTIENRDDRNSFVKRIITVMKSFNPSMKDSEDYQRKLWNHLIIMSDFELDIDSPFEYPTKESVNMKPLRIPYPRKEIRRKHYGKSVELLLQKAIEIDDEKERTAFIRGIANQMKRSFVEWNGENITDNMIFYDIHDLTNGLLDIPQNLKLMEMRAPSQKNQGRKGSNNRGSIQKKKKKKPQMQQQRRRR